MSDYVPTKWQVEDAYVKGYGSFAPGEHEKSLAEFDRWLATHDREVAAKAVLELNRSLTSAINSAWVSDRGVINRIIEILDETL